MALFSGLKLQDELDGLMCSGESPFDTLPTRPLTSGSHHHHQTTRANEIHNTSPRSPAWDRVYNSDLEAHDTIVCFSLAHFRSLVLAIVVVDQTIVHV